MARLPRFVLPGQPQHIIQRGNNREIERQGQVSNCESFVINLIRV